MVRNRGNIYVVLGCLLMMVLSTRFASAQTQEKNVDGERPKVVRLTRSFVQSMYFPWDDDNIHENYLTNAKTLKTLRHMIDSIGVQNIDSVNIIVQSSPEGRTAYNIDLSKRRAFKTELYFAEKFADVYPVTHVVADGESWVALRRYIMRDSVLTRAEKQKAVGAIDIRNVERRKEVFQKLDTYPYIFRTYYPYLRNTVIATIYSTTYVAYEELKKIRETYPDSLISGTTVWDGTSTGAGQAVGYPGGDQHVTIINNYYNTNYYINWTANDSIMRHPKFALKTNLLFDAATLLNGEIEIPVGKRWSVMAEVVWPWWLQKSHNRWCVEMGEVGLETRYWFHAWKRHSTYQKWCEERNIPLVGFFMGAYINAAYFDFQLHRDHGVQGETAGAGLTFGYSKLLSRHWRMEFSLGVGASPYRYRKYHIDENTEVDPQRDQHLWRDTPRGEDIKKLWIGPTKAKISLSWLLYGKCKKGGKR